MTIAYTPAAWLGLRRHTADPQVRLLVDKLDALYRRTDPVWYATVAGGVLTETVTAHRRWSTARRI